MKKIVLVALCFFGIIGISNISYASPVTLLAGDKDFGADRDTNDQLTNMDYFVFPKNSGGGYSDPADNDKGLVSWSYDDLTSADLIASGTLTIRAFDIDPIEEITVWYSVDGGALTELGTLTTLPEINDVQWDTYVNAVLDPLVGTAEHIDAWTTTYLTLTSDFLAALNSTSLSNITFSITNDLNDKYWGAVIDYAELTLNPVPEPATMLLFGTGLTCFLGAGIHRRKKLY